MTLALVVGFFAGLLAGAGLAALAALGHLRRSSSAGLLERGQLREALTRAEAALDHERRAVAERQAVWDEQRGLLASEFAKLSTEALRTNNEQFLQLADTRLQKTQQAATGELEQRRQAFEQLLTPFKEQLGRYEIGMRELETARVGAYSKLEEQVRQLSASQDKLQGETRNLVTALRAPATRGRWGEMQLRRVVEMAGMVEHCDFDEQVSAQGEDGRVRPDLVVYLPGEKHVVVDAKVPLQAFLDANEATEEAVRREHLESHARHLRAHIDGLAKKSYWQQFDPSPDFVVAFIPGDSLLGAALEHDPGLLEHAFSKNVIPATPTTLIAVLRSVAYSWQQASLADNARHVQQLGRDLYRRLATFGEHLAKTGKSLTGAVDAYNRAVGSLERNVLPQARRFGELGVVAGGEDSLPVLEPIDATARLVQAPELQAPEGRRSTDAEVVQLPVHPLELPPLAGEG